MAEMQTVSLSMTKVKVICWLSVEMMIGFRL